MCNINHIPFSGDLLKEFFEFYQQFDFEKNAVSLFNSEVFPKPVSEELEMSAMHIQNPLEHELNVCKNVTQKEVDFFKQSCGNALDRLDKTDTKSRYWGLLKILGTEDDQSKKVNVNIGQIFSEEKEEKEEDTLKSYDLKGLKEDGDRIYGNWDQQDNVTREQTETGVRQISDVTEESDGKLDNVIEQDNVMKQTEASKSQAATEGSTNAENRVIETGDKLEKPMPSTGDKLEKPMPSISVDKYVISEVKQSKKSKGDVAIGDQSGVVGDSTVSHDEGKDKKSSLNNKRQKYKKSQGRQKKTSKQDEGEKIKQLQLFDKSQQLNGSRLSDQKQSNDASEDNDQKQSNDSSEDNDQKQSNDSSEDNVARAVDSHTWPW